MTAGKSIRLFLVDGTPGGLLTAEIMNWTGHVIAAPRSDVASLLKRSEAHRTGIYILLGDDPNKIGGTLAYIGEADDISKRLYEHGRPEEQGGKDFWNRAILLSSKDTNLTKAHARYLESRLITLARQADRAVLTNSTAPPPLPLPEADVSDMEFFISQAKIILPVLGVNLFRAGVVTQKSRQSNSMDASQGDTSPVFEMIVKKYGISATAQEIDGEFSVIQGSTARLEWEGVDDGYKRLREQLEKDGTLEITEDGKYRRFTRNQVFASPSAAARVVAGRSANGRVEWKVQGTGVTYGSWQNEGLEQALKEGRYE